MVAGYIVRVAIKQSAIFAMSHTISFNSTINVNAVGAVVSIIHLQMKILQVKAKIN